MAAATDLPLNSVKIYLLQKKKKCCRGQLKKNNKKLDDANRTSHFPPTPKIKHDFLCLADTHVIVIFSSHSFYHHCPGQRERNRERDRERERESDGSMRERDRGRERERNKESERETERERERI
jgi:hypothetical protein